MSEELNFTDNESLEDLARVLASVQDQSEDQQIIKLEAELRNSHSDYTLASLARRLCEILFLQNKKNQKFERFALLSLESFVRSGHPEGAIGLVLWLRDFAHMDSLTSQAERKLVNSYGRKPRQKKAADDHLPLPTPYQEISAQVSFEEFPGGENFYREQLRRTEPKNFPLFSNLKTAEVARLMRVAELRSLKKGKYLFKEGEKPQGFYILSEGRAELQGSAGLRKELEPGDFVGDLALFASMTHTAGAQATEDSQFVYFPREKLFECFKYIPRLREELTDLFHRRLFIAQAQHSLIFSMIDRGDLDKCWEYFVPIHVAQGHTLMEPGMFADRFYLILRGKVEVLKNGQSPVYLGPGHFVGERGLILKTTRNATLTTISDCDLLECDRWSYQELLENFSVLNSKIEERRPDYENYQFSSRNFVID